MLGARLCGRCGGFVAPMWMSVPEREMLELYPNVKAKGLRLKMRYSDSLAGKVEIEMQT